MIGEWESNVASLWAYIDTAYIVITAMVGLRLLRAAMRARPGRLHGGVGCRPAVEPPGGGAV